MEKTQNASPSVVLKKAVGENEKIIFRLSRKSLMRLLGCFVFSLGSVFSEMTPFGIAFYAAVFQKESWVPMLIVSLISVIFFSPGTKLIYIASLILITALFAVIDTGRSKWKAPLFASGVFLLLKLLHSFVMVFNMYTIFEAFVEAGLIFCSCFVFEKSFPLIVSAAARNFISVREKLCVMAFFAILSLSLAVVEPLHGFNLSNVFSVLMIYIFSLGGVSGGAVMLGVLLGAAGSLKAGSFSDITSTFAFGALLGSSFSAYGRVAVVLGFVTANTLASFVLSDSVNVAMGIYDSIAASVIFFLLPDKLCSHISAVFSKSASCVTDNEAVYTRLSSVTEKRLDKMSRSLGELSDLYSRSARERCMGKDYIMAKFGEVTSAVCVGCSHKSQCFKGRNSHGYQSMVKMLDVAFKNGKITTLTLPTEFKNQCNRHSAFAEKFNSVFDVIKTEKQWVSKLDECRLLVSEQLCALSASIENEKNKCRVKIDTATEEALWAELDKEGIYPVKILAEKYAGGNFCISVYMARNAVKQQTGEKIKQCVSAVAGCNLAFSEPGAEGQMYAYRFFPAKKYSLTSGYASRCKSNEQVSGDAFAVIHGEGGEVNVIISDGMGSGSGAAKESRFVVEMMKKFIGAGIKSSTAVKLVNSSLLMCSTRDSFSTVDMCTINLSDATYEITKLGAAKSYIRQGENILCVKPGSLPVGILREIEAQSNMFSIDSDTVIVLMSDGVADIELKYPQFEGWIDAELSAMNTMNSQLIATRLIEKASRLVNNEVYDDMTVVAVSIQKV